MNIFARIFKIFQSEANNAVEKLEDPIKMTEQGIRDLKNDLEKSLKALAEVKAMAIRAKRESDTYQKQSADYENKAMLLIRKGSTGELSPDEADRLAESALTKKTEADANIQRSLQEHKRFNENVSKLDVAVKRLRSDVSKYENELKTLKARAKVSAATKRVNKQLSGVDSPSTVAMLERMKERVDQSEAEAEAYSEIAGESKSVDDEINKALEGTSTSSSSALAELKAKMNPVTSEPDKAIENAPVSETKSALDDLKKQLNEEKEIRSDKVDE